MHRRQPCVPKKNQIPFYILPGDPLEIPTFQAHDLQQIFTKSTTLLGLGRFHGFSPVLSPISQDFPMVFAPFGRAVRGNFRAAAPRAGCVPLRPELPEPRQLPAVPKELQRRPQKNWMWCQLLFVRIISVSNLIGAILTNLTILSISYYQGGRTDGFVTISSLFATGRALPIMRWSWVEGLFNVPV